MKRVGTFVTALLVGVAPPGGTAVYAVAIMAGQSTNRFLVDGQDAQLNAYASSGNDRLMCREPSNHHGLSLVPK